MSVRPALFPKHTSLNYSPHLIRKCAQRALANAGGSLDMLMLIKNARGFMRHDKEKFSHMLAIYNRIVCMKAEGDVTICGDVVSLITNTKEVTP